MDSGKDKISKCYLCNATKNVHGYFNSSNSKFVLLCDDCLSPDNIKKESEKINSLKPLITTLDAYNSLIGKKFDQEKDRWDLLPFESVTQIVKVLTFGAKKYEPNNWQKVPEAKSRYFAACMRHLNAWWGGEKIDPESGIHHLAHAGCCILFLLWFEGK